MPHLPVTRKTGSGFSDFVRNESKKSHEVYCRSLGKLPRTVSLNLHLSLFACIERMVANSLARTFHEGNGNCGNEGCSNRVNDRAIAMACAILFRLRSHNSGTPDRRKTIQVKNAFFKTP